MLETCRRLHYPGRLLQPLAGTRRAATTAVENHLPLQPRNRPRKHRILHLQCSDEGIPLGNKRSIVARKRKSIGGRIDTLTHTTPRSVNYFGEISTWGITF
jgi:hypothetical protein